MKVVLTIEDSLKGVEMHRRVSFNGVQDGTERSLAMHILANFEQHLAQLMRLHSIVVTEREDVPPPRR